MAAQRVYEVSNKVTSFLFSKREYAEAFISANFTAATMPLLLERAVVDFDITQFSAPPPPRKRLSESIADAIQNVWKTGISKETLNGVISVVLLRQGVDDKEVG